MGLVPDSDPLDNHKTVSLSSLTASASVLLEKQPVSWWEHESAHRVQIEGPPGTYLGMMMSLTLLRFGLLICGMGNSVYAIGLLAG